MKKILFVVLDGLADRPYDELGGFTPLEAARTPNLDQLASLGATGLMHPVGRGRAPGSELAHFVLFGYPEDRFPGRVVFEAAGAGFDLSAEEVAFRALFSSVEERNGELWLLNHFAHASDEVCSALAEEIGEFEHEGLVVRLAFTGDRQGILTVSAADGSPADVRASEHVTDCDPFFPGRPIAAVRALADAPDAPAAERTARAVTAYLRHVYRSLEAHPSNRDAPPAERANFVLVKWTGRRAALPRFEALTGMRGASVSTGTLFRGIARELGLAHVELPYLDDLGEDLANRLAHARRALDDGADYVHVHTKAPDEAGHRKDPVHKRDVIASVDAGLSALLQPGALAEDTLLVVTGDHGTPACTGLIHSGDPVPFLLVSSNVRPDSVVFFGEADCTNGALGQFTGADVMPMLLNLRGTTRYLGARLDPEVGLAWPEDYEAFSVE